MRLLDLPGALLATICVYTVTAVFTAVGLVLFFVGGWAVQLLAGWSTERSALLWIWMYGRAWLIGLYPFLRFSRRGFPPSGDYDRPAVLVVNHLSFFDTFFMGGLPFFDVTFAVRAWPFKMPWFKPMMVRAGYLDVESEPFDVTLEKGRKILARGGHILYFPEGHRSRDGKIGRFYSGAFRLSRETGAPVVPLCITGTERLLPPKRSWMQPTKVRLTALAPVEPTDYDGELAHREMMADVRKRIARQVELQRAGEEGFPGGIPR